jgi:hypothetical protein
MKLNLIRIVWLMRRGMRGGLRIEVVKRRFGGYERNGAGIKDKG